MFPLTLKEEFNNIEVFQAKHFASVKCPKYKTVYTYPAQNS